MIGLTKNEKKILLVIFGDFNSYYNANSISKIVGVSRIGAMKILKKFLRENVLYSERIGKSIVYKLRLNDDYVRNLMSFILADEANNYKRWKEEFKEIYGGDRIIVLFGSVIKNYERAGDIDVMIILNKGEEKLVDSVLKEKEKVLPKKLHVIKLTSQDFLGGIKAKNKAIIDIVKNSIILYNQNKYVEILKNVTGI